MVALSSGNEITISRRTLKRLPVYLNYLKRIRKEGVMQISFPAIAKAVELSEMQVKKDISAVTTKSGKPKIGHNIDDLIKDISSFLDYNTITNAVLIGVGHLGKALLTYDGFREYGLKIVGAFDNNKALIGTKIKGVKIQELHNLKALCNKNDIDIGIITTNAEPAQAISDKLVENGITAIWNFAPIHIKTPDYVIVQNENMASNLAVLSRHLKKKKVEK